MPIPLQHRIKVRTLLEPVSEFTRQIDDLHGKIRMGMKGVVNIPVADYIKFLEEARRIQYIVTGLATASIGINLLMPDNKEALSFRSEMDAAILQQLKELDNDKPDIIIIDNGNL